MDISQTTIESKKTFSLPEGAEVIKKEVNIRVEEIENGFIVRKGYEIQWQDIGGGKHWDNVDKKWYSKTNPITISTPKDMKLSDNF